jgi:hypothetical protein
MPLMINKTKITGRFLLGLIFTLVVLTLSPVRAAESPVERFRPLAGYLVQAGPQGVVIDCGGRKGTAVGDLFVGFQPGPPLVHPVTGKPMGVQERRLATLKVVRVEADYSICRPLRRYLQVPLQRGLPVRRFALMAALFIDLNGNGAELFSRVREDLPGLDWADYSLGLRYRESLRRPGGPGALGYDLYVVSQGPELAFYNGDQELVGAWKASLFTGRGAAAGRSGAPSGAAGGKYTMSTEEAGKAILTRYRNLAEVNLVVKGMDIGDLDGDGVKEIVFTDGEKIFVYQATPKGLKFRYRYLFDRWGSIVNITVGDVNGDRRDEIIVNIFKETEDGFSSFILGLEKGHYRVMASHVPFVMGLLGGHSVADRGCVFVGQGFAEEILFGGKVSLLKFSGGKVVSTGQFAVPEGFTLPGALYADVNHDGKRELCFINPRNFMEIYRGDRRLWMSDERIGGSLLDVQYEVGTEKVSYTEKRQICSPMRFIDVDGDGRRDLVACDNKSGMSTSFGDYGFLSQGYVRMVRSTGTGFVVGNVTGRIGGPIQGLLPLGNELVVAMVKRGEDMLKQSGTTFLLAFPLPEAPGNR